MAKVMLLISKIGCESTQLQVKCTLSEHGGMEDAACVGRIFLDPREMEAVLKAAGVSDEEAQAPYHVFNNDLPTFIPISKDIARKLGMLI